MKLYHTFGLISFVTALSVDLSKRDSPLDVNLEVIGNTAVLATITNKGDSSLRLLKNGTILDETATEKVKVFQKESQIPFSAVRVYISTRELDDSAFQTINAGVTIDTSFDIADTHDVSAGGTFDILANSAISYAEAGSIDLVGILPLKTNIVAVKIDGAQASATQQSFLRKVKRTAVQSDCTGTKGRIPPESDLSLPNPCSGSCIRCTNQLGQKSLSISRATRHPFAPQSQTSSKRLLRNAITALRGCQSSIALIPYGVAAEVL